MRNNEILRREHMLRGEKPGNIVILNGTPRSGKLVESMNKEIQMDGIDRFDVIFDFN
jgi:hypothetical protein